MGLDPITMLKRYTPEAFNFILQGIIYNINEQTKEGRKKNKIQSIRKDNQKEVTTDDDMEKIRKAREKYKELFNQKNG
jgi:adenine-specific DNA methylase